ncbi:ankyrin repeat protein [Thecamonas trahens ATCC 50062]|uniref:Ankyrin repeat protein n=1 Tax=Thecamonas trahens ATCC 50062 TaxID=461836 RepID=A0A0L0DTV3_THETB|nr:ankyrin repeat protein [Thecamonas trahens ATCC 50062]KNC55764.1 ankyrin repeat protein [Thecamonas trahens ATCC 50062]|eukprot:XP_013752848.1 ankyrin repeat protein [Thecamonas trahens ATCC 50062]
MSSTLVAAVNAGDVERVRELVGNPNEAASLGLARSGLTVLHTAVSLKDAGVVQALIAGGADVNAKTDDDAALTPLQMAVRAGASDLVKVLLDAEASIEAPPGSLSVLHDVSSTFNGAKILKIMFDERCIDVDVRGPGKNTPLHSAAASGYAEVAELFLRARADTAAVNADGQTPLTLAIEGGHLGLVRLLLDYGADPTQKRGDKLAPLAVAVSAGLPAMYRIILAALPIQNIDESVVLSALELPAQDALDVLTLIHNDMPDDPIPRTRTKAGETPLHIAASSGLRLADVALYLIEKYPSMATTLNKAKSSPLFSACASPELSVDLISALLAAGCDPNATNKSKATPLLVLISGHSVDGDDDGDEDDDEAEAKAAIARAAARRGIWATEPTKAADVGTVVVALVAAGANPFHTDKSGSSALHLAIRSGATEVAKLMLTALIAAAEAKGAPLVVAADSSSSSPRSSAGESGGGSLGTTADSLSSLSSLSPSVLMPAATALDKRGLTPLHYAVLTGSHELVALMTGAGASGLATQSKATRRAGQTALHMAAASGHVRIVLTLLSSGAEPNITDEARRLPLHYVLDTEYTAPEVVDVPPAGDLPAVSLPDEAKRLLIARLLLESGSKIAADDSAGLTPLHLAARNSLTHVTELLLALGASPYALTKKKETVFDVASTPCKAFVSNALSDAPILLRGQLAWLTRGKMTKSVSWQRRYGVLRPSRLMLYASAKKYEAAPDSPLLVVPLGMPATSLEMASSTASSRRGMSTVSLLDDSSAPSMAAAAASGAAAEPSAADGGAEQPPLTSSSSVHIRHPHGDAIISADGASLIEAWYIALVAASRVHPLHASVIRPDPALTQVLLAGGADPHAADALGATPLHVAAAWGRTEQARALLQAGADADARDRFSLQPMHHAILTRNLDLVDVLLDYKATGSAASAWGATALDLLVPSLMPAVRSAQSRPRVRTTPKPPPLAYYYARARNALLDLNPREMAETIMLHSLDVNALDPNTGVGLLHYSAVLGLPEALKFLSMLGAQLDLVSLHGTPPLLLGVVCGHHNVVEALLAVHSEVDAVDASGASAADLAQTESMNLLLQRGAALHSGWLVKRGGGTSLLGRKSWKRRWFVLRSKVISYYEGSGSTEVLGSIPMPSPVERDDEAGKDKRYHFRVITPKRTYYLASESKREVKDWVNAITSVNTESASLAEFEQLKATLFFDPAEHLPTDWSGEYRPGKYALHHAVDAGTVNFASLASSFDGSAHKRHFRYSVLHFLAVSPSARLKVASALLSSLRSVLDSRDAFERTPLHLAVAAGNASLVQAFIDAGADVNAVDNCGRGVLHSAALVGNASIVRALLDAGAEAATADSVAGYYPAHLTGDDDCAQLLTAACGNGLPAEPVGKANAVGSVELDVAGMLERARESAASRALASLPKASLPVMTAAAAELDELYTHAPLNLTKDPEAALLEMQFEYVFRDPVSVPHEHTCAMASLVSHPVLKRLLLTDALAARVAAVVSAAVEVALATPDNGLPEHREEASRSQLASVYVQLVNGTIGTRSSAVALFAQIVDDVAETMTHVLEAEPRAAASAQMWMHTTVGPALGAFVYRPLMLTRIIRYLSISLSKDTVVRFASRPASLDVPAPLALSDIASMATSDGYSVIEMFTNEFSSYQEVLAYMSALATHLGSAPASRDLLILYGRGLFELARRSKDKKEQPRLQLRTNRVLWLALRGYDEPGLARGEDGTKSLLLYFAGKHVWASRKAAEAMRLAFAVAIYSLPHEAIAAHKRDPSASSPVMHGLVALVPKLFEYYCRLLEQSKEYTLALIHYREAIRFSPGYRAHHIDAVRMSRLCKLRSDRTAEVFDLLCHVYADEPDTWAEYALHLMQTNDVHAAGPLLRKALGLDPTHAKSRKYLKLLISKYPTLQISTDAELLVRGSSKGGAGSSSGAGPGGRMAAGPGGRMMPGGGGGGAGGGNMAHGQPQQLQLGFQAGPGRGGMSPARRK